MDDLIKRAAEDLSKAKRATALTGAGVSVESGIPPFRGKGGLWEKYDPMEVAHINSFLQNPEKVWKLLFKDMKEVLDRAAPNDCHKGLAKLEKLGILTTIITQNVDGLHQMAGSGDVIEFHGNMAWQRCMECHKRYATSSINLDHIPPRCSCDGILRPDAVLFGEMIPPDALWRSREAASVCDIMLVIGTSAVVQPAALMPVIAKESGAKIIEINPEHTPLTDSISDYLIRGTAGDIMNRILSQLEKLL